MVFKISEEHRRKLSLKKIDNKNARKIFTSSIA